MHTQRLGERTGAEPAATPGLNLLLLLLLLLWG